jgi:hypothetical protein
MRSIKEDGSSTDERREGQPAFLADRPKTNVTQ